MDTYICKWNMHMNKIYVHGYAYGCGYRDAFVHICVEDSFTIQKAMHMECMPTGLFHVGWICMCACILNPLEINKS